MAKVLPSPACDASLLSAYYDEALDDVQRGLVERHVQSCLACRQELVQYADLTADLYRLAVRPARPLPIDDLVRRAQRPPRRTWLPRSTSALFGSAVAVALLLVFLFQRVPARPATLFAAYPASGASDVSTDTAITIVFQQPVDQAQVQRSLHFEPPVPFDVRWTTPQRASIIPLTPLAASTTYTLQATLATSPSATAAPLPTLPPASPTLAPKAQTLTVFHTAVVSTAQARPTSSASRSDALTRALPSNDSQQVLAVAPTPSPVGLTAASSRAVATPAPPAATVTAIAPKRTARHVETPAVTAASATATASPKAPARVAVAAVSQPHVTTALETRSTGPVATASTATAANSHAAPISTTAAASQSPTQVATVAATVAATEGAGGEVAALPTAAASSCAPGGSFAAIYAQRSDVRSALGCASGSAQRTTVESQSFQRGIVLAVFPENLLYQFAMAGTWSAASFGSGAAGPVAPGVATTVGPTFRSYWVAHPALAAMLGAPVAPEEASEGVRQPFANGLMLATGGWVYIVDDAGQWQRVASVVPGSAGSDGEITGGVPSFPPMHIPLTRVASFGSPARMATTTPTVPAGATVSPSPRR